MCAIVPIVFAPSDLLVHEVRPSHSIMMPVLGTGTQLGVIIGRPTGLEIRLSPRGDILSAPMLHL